MKRTKSKSRRGLVTRRIVYRNRHRPQDRPQELTMDARCDEKMEEGYAAAIVAIRTGMPLADVKILAITM